MNRGRHLGLVTLLLASSALAACAAPASAEAGEDVNDLTSGSLFPDAAVVLVTSPGGGAVPAGSECAPGEGRWSYTRPARRLDATVCVKAGATLRVQRTVATLDEGSARELDAAIAGVARAPAPGCGKGKAVVKIVFSSTTSEPGANVFVDAHNACPGATSNLAVGLDRVIATLLALPPGAPQPPALTPAKVAAGELAKGQRSLSVKKGGDAGLMPPGSECIPGSEEYAFNLETGVMTWNRCDAVDARGHFFLSLANRASVPSSELDALLARAAEVSTSTSKVCAPPAAAAPRLRLSTMAPSNKLAVYVDDAYACEAPELSYVRGATAVLEAARAAAHDPDGTQSLAPGR